MDGTRDGYSAAQELRSGGRATVRQALLEIRQCTLQAVQAWMAAGPHVPRQAWLNPPVWEWGHLAWFQEWWIARNPECNRGAAADPDVPRRPSLLPRADAWYDSSRVAHARRWDLPLPAAPATLAYLADTLATTLELLDALPSQASQEDLYFFRLAALHEAMHAEASAYMARGLGIQLPGGPAPARAGGPSALPVPAQAFRVGSSGPGFAFDNELPAHEVSLGPFEIDAEPLSWPRFHDFVRDGGYGHRRWWSAEGWAWRQAARPQPPSAGAGEVGAVHLSAYEAEAWCRWAGRRLPTEFEWECAALTQPAFRWGGVWEWTASAFLPYAGFAPHPYRDYSAPWFGSRRVLRGAAAASSRWLAHPRYRNFFEPQRTDIFAGFRSCSAS